jgi:pyruvate,orthophosphate dikinase
MGAREFYFDFQFDGQGEDVVGGRRNLTDHDRLRLTLPGIWTRLNETCRTLETLFGDAQDFEFTVQSGELYL